MIAHDNEEEATTSDSESSGEEMEVSSYYSSISESEQDLEDDSDVEGTASNYGC